jgi:hypothetical protein
LIFFVSTHLGELKGVAFIFEIGERELILSRVDSGMYAPYDEQGSGSEYEKG